MFFRQHTVSSGNGSAVIYREISSFILDHAIWSKKTCQTLLKMSRCRAIKSTFCMVIIKHRYDDMSRHSTHQALVSQTQGTEIKLIWPLKTPRNKNILYVTQYLFNSLWTSDTIWRHKSGSTLAQVMACCLTAPSHYLNQSWLVIGKVQWLSSECNFTRDALAISHWN